MSDRQLQRPLRDIASELKPLFWGRQIQGAPKSVILMAECKVLASKPSAMTLDLSEFNLPRTTLHGNIDHCTRLGEDTFRSTAIKMGRVGYLTNEMSKPEGIIESMLKFIDPDQSRVRDKMLDRHITRGSETIVESVRMVKEVQEKFTAWGQATQDLYSALTDKAGTNELQQRETRSKIKKESEDKKRLEKKIEEERRELERLEKLHKTAFGIYDEMLKSFPSEINGELQSIPYRCIATIDSLKADVAEIVAKALKNLKNLQEETKMFLNFLTTIQEMMVRVGDKKDDVFMGDLTPQERRELICDRELKEKLKEDALRMKTQFLIAAKATSMYNEVSAKFVIPAVDWEARLHLHDLRDCAADTKVKEIEEWKVKICDGADKLIDKVSDTIHPCTTAVAHAEQNRGRPNTALS
ncbi:hypothetical protein LZ31DRAFT_604988 [Colletotrichum somersetense]|nr:hypothetical protein LZ31DRAFT_604988 [Colletotrichum somersetense]